MQIDVLTVFPQMFVSPLSESIVKRAVGKKTVDIQIHDLRNFATDAYKTVDDRPYGGGPGMVMKVDLIDRALENLGVKKQTENSRIVLLSAKGNKYTQEVAQNYAKLERLILIAGHYEGVDERVAENLIDEEIRIGDYVLTGGELPAMVIIDSVVRLIPSVLGNSSSLNTESHSSEGYLEYPQYTRPADYKGWKVPEVLLNGNHAEIEKWKQEQARQEK
jgi:tRNA (guanine37-N1)-methyltransferase